MQPKKKQRMTSLTMTMMTILNPLKHWKLQSNVMLHMSEILLRLCQRINHTRKDQLHFQPCQTSLSIKSNMNIPRSQTFFQLPYKALKKQEGMLQIFFFLSKSLFFLEISTFNQLSFHQPFCFYKVVHLPYTRHYNPRFVYF